MLPGTFTIVIQDWLSKKSIKVWGTTSFDNSQKRILHSNVQDQRFDLEINGLSLIINKIISDYPKESVEKHAFQFGDPDLFEKLNKVLS